MIKEVFEKLIKLAEKKHPRKQLGWEARFVVTDRTPHIQILPHGGPLCQRWGSSWKSHYGLAAIYVNIVISQDRKTIWFTCPEGFKDMRFEAPKGTFFRCDFFNDINSVILKDTVNYRKIRISNFDRLLYYRRQLVEQKKLTPFLTKEKVFLIRKLLKKYKLSFLKTKKGTYQIGKTTHKVRSFREFICFFRDLKKVMSLERSFIVDDNVFAVVNNETGLKFHFEELKPDRLISADVNLATKVFNFRKLETSLSKIKRRKKVEVKTARKLGFCPYGIKKFLGNTRLFNRGWISSDRFIKLSKEPRNKEWKREVLIISHHI